MSQFIHPHVSTNIIDNSFAFITTEGLTTLFVAFTADKGRDRELVETTSPSEYIFNFNEPSMSRHGQAQLNAYRWVQAGGKAYCLRVTADDAAYAHQLLEIRTKMEESADPDTGEATTILKVKTATTVMDPLYARDKDAIRLAVNESLNDSPEDSEGYKRYPLAIARAPGRGSIYNNTGYRLSIDSAMDDTFNFRTYEFEVIERDPVDGAVSLKEGAFSVALSADAISPLDRSALGIEDVVRVYAQEIEVEFLEDGMDALDLDLGINVDLVDWVSGSNKILRGVEEVDPFKDSEISSVEFVTEGEDFADFSSINYLQGGSDGDTSIENVESLLAKAYSGLTTPEITDKDWTEVDVVLDANYPPMVKEAMVTLARDIRNDCMTFLDTGFTARPDQAIDKRRNSLTYNTFYAAIFTQDLIVDDVFTNREIRVTPTYILANKIPSNDRQHGTHKPFVGPRRGGVTGFKSVSWFPTEPQKTELYKAQLNYIERTPKRTNFGSQLTSQVATSDLSNISIVRTLFKIIRRMRSVAQEFPFELNNKDTENALVIELNGIGNDYVSNGACEFVTPKILTTEYQRRRKILHVAVEVKFTALVERILMDFIVTK